MSGAGKTYWLPRLGQEINLGQPVNNQIMDPEMLGQIQGIGALYPPVRPAPTNVNEITAPSAGLPVLGEDPPPMGAMEPLEPKAGAAGMLPFDPSGTGYDYDSARAAGMGPTGTGENAGHWGSVAPAPASAKLPSDSYMMLKGRQHESWDKGVAGEEARGSRVMQLGDRSYSVPLTPLPGSLPIPEQAAAGGEQGFGWGHALMALSGGLEGFGAGMQGRSASVVPHLMQGLMQQQTANKALAFQEKELGVRQNEYERAGQEKLLQHYPQFRQILANASPAELPGVTAKLQGMAEKIGGKGSGDYISAIKTHPFTMAALTRLIGKGNSAVAAAIAQESDPAEQRKLALQYVGSPAFKVEQQGVAAKIVGNLMQTMPADMKQLFGDENNPVPQHIAMQHLKTLAEAYTGKDGEKLDDSDLQLLQEYALDPAGQADLSNRNVFVATSSFEAQKKQAENATTPKAKRIRELTAIVENKDGRYTDKYVAEAKTNLAIAHDEMDKASHPTKNDLGNDREAIVRELFQTKYGEGVTSKNLNETETAVVNARHKKDQADITAGKIKATHETKLDFELKEHAQLWFDNEGNNPAPTMTEREAMSLGMVAVLPHNATAVMMSKAALEALKEYEDLIPKLLSKKTKIPGFTGMGVDIVKRIGTAAFIKMSALAGDEDATRLQAMSATLPTQIKALGDSGNIAVQERVMAEEASVNMWNSQESATAVVKQLRRIITGIVKARGVVPPKGSDGRDTAAAKPAAKETAKDTPVMDAMRDRYKHYREQGLDKDAAMQKAQQDMTSE